MSDPETYPYKAPVQHSMKRRARAHDYRAKGFYMLTLCTEGRRPLFGELRTGDKPHIHLTKLGMRIRYHEINKINRYYPMVTVWRYCIMPDHIHLIVGVKEQMPEGTHLGQVVAGFKYGCTKAWLRTGAPEGSVIFEDGYNDRLLYSGDQLERWKHYLADNPRRLALKRLHPDLFYQVHDREVEGRACQCVGNIFLLEIPDKMAVVVHRADSDEEYRQKFNRWMACGERGGVLVGASIAPREKAVFREAFDRGYFIILLRENGFPELYKPSGEAFDACAEGRLLELSPHEYTYRGGRKITRGECLELNAMAEAMACVPPDKPAPN